MDIVKIEAEIKQKIEKAFEEIGVSQENAKKYVDYITGKKTEELRAEIEQTISLKREDIEALKENFKVFKEALDRADFNEDGEINLFETIEQIFAKISANKTELDNKIAEANQKIKESFKYTQEEINNNRVKTDENIQNLAKVVVDTFESATKNLKTKLENLWKFDATPVDGATTIGDTDNINSNAL